MGIRSFWLTAAKWLGYLVVLLFATFLLAIPGFDFVNNKYQRWRYPEYATCVDDGKQYYYGDACTTFIASPITSNVWVEKERNAIYSIRGMTFSTHEEYDKAISEFTSALRYSKDPVIFRNLANAFDSAGDCQGAMDPLTQSFRFDATDRENFFYRGNLFMTCRSDAEMAIANYDQAISLDPNKSSYYYRRGLAYKAKGELQRAQEDFSAAVHVEPQFWRQFDYVNIFGFNVETAVRREYDFATFGSKLAPPYTTLKDRSK